MITAHRKAIRLLHIQVYRLSNPLASLKTVVKHLQFWWFLLFSRSCRIFTKWMSKYPRPVRMIPPQAGFTLLEVMMAIAIMAIALTTLLGSQTQSISLATEAKFLTTASLLAKGKMAELELTESGKIHSASGDFGDDFPGYGWDAQVNDFSIAELGDFSDFTSHLKQVDVEIFWEAAGQRKFRFFMRHYRFDHEGGRG